MSGIPVHVQRSFEQRWAAKLASSGTSARSKAIDLKGTVNSLPRPATAKETNDDQHSISGGLVRRLSCLAARVVFNALALILREVSDGKCGTCRARSHVRGASRKSDRFDIPATLPRNGRLLSIAVSRTPGRSSRMRVGGPSGSLFKRQVVLDLAPSLTIRRLVELGLKAKSK